VATRNALCSGAQWRVARVGDLTQKWLVLVPSLASSRDLAPSSSTRHCASRRTFSSRCLRLQGPAARERGGAVASSHFARPWAIPLIACVGALAGAVLVFTVAPEAEGHGTDAAIAAVHHNPVEFVCALSS